MRLTRLIVPALATVLISMLFVGCTPKAPAPTPAPAPAPTPAPAPAPTPAPSVIPPEPSGKYAQPNPLWGVAIKPDGTPYKIAFEALFLYNDWTKCEVGVLQSLIERAGGQLSVHDPSMDIAKAVEIMDDLIVTKPDAIMIHAVDSNALIPLVAKAKAAGIPCFGQNFLVQGEVCGVRHDQFDTGRVPGQWIADQAKQTGKKITVYELWGAMGTEGSQARHTGFHEIVDGNPLIEVIESPDTGWVHEKGVNAILDAIPAHPAINAIYSQGDLVEATTEALKTLGKLYPAGDPKHISFVTCDEDPGALNALRAGYVDAVAAHGPWEVVDGDVKATLTYVCLGKQVPELVEFPSYAVTKQNVDAGRWGAPRIWGDMFQEQPDFNKWPILNLPAEYGLITPTVAMK